MRKIRLSDREGVVVSEKGMPMNRNHSIADMPVEESFHMLTQLLSSENTTTFNNRIASATSVNEAIFLSWFIWMWKEKSRNREMFIVEQSFSDKTSISKHGFRTIVKKWEQLGLITTECKGLPLKKWYRLDEEMLVSYLCLLIRKDNPSTSKGITPETLRGLTPQLLRGYIKVKERVKSKDCREGSKPPQRPRPKTLNLHGRDKARSSERLLAIKLFKILLPILRGAPNKLPKRDPQTGHRDFSQWAREFRRLVRAGAGHPQINKALDWYAHHLRDTYTPRCYSARTFCEKYVQVLDAMKREHRESMKNDPIASIPPVDQWGNPMDDGK